MTYFLDFDRTLFDTDRFYTFLIQHNLIPEPHRATLTTAIEGRADYSTEAWRLFNAAVESGDFPFVTENTSQFLFSDVSDFFSRHGSESVIVSVGLVPLQRAKIERTGLTPLVRSVLYVGLKSKGEGLAAEYPTPIADAVFVDDSPRQLESVAEHCPWLKLYEMRRDGKEGSGKYPVIRSLAELPAE